MDVAGPDEEQHGDAAGDRGESGDEEDLGQAGGERLAGGSDHVVRAGREGRGEVVEASGGHGAGRFGVGDPAPQSSPAPTTTIPSQASARTGAKRVSPPLIGATRSIVTDSRIGADSPGVGVLTGYTAAFSDDADEERDRYYRFVVDTVLAGLERFLAPED
ncbi:hypothetical protein [Glycomyces salinus]|uniref:hypothetical protein n=1 Tax=Glycomyces salinus TaxID=980294 RepID=UPI0018EB810C|nr:hypothetical protein [Glycomyces salinus]